MPRTTRDAWPRRAGLALAFVVGLASRAHAGEPAPDGALEVPFLYEGSSIVLEARVDGEHRLRMLLDTGWHPTTLDTRAARTLGWIGPGQGAAEAQGHHLRELALGAVTVHDWPADVADLVGINPAGTAPYDGVIGCSLLRERIVQIDYARRMLRVLPGDAAAPVANERRTVLPIHFSRLGCLAITDSAWVGGRQLSALFDTGGGMSILVTPRAVDYLGLQDSVRRMRTVTSGYFDEDSTRAGVARLGRLARVRVGGFVADTVQAVFASAGEGLLDQPLETWGLIIGNRYLERYLVTFDYRNNLVALERPVEPPAPARPKKR